MRAFTFAVMVLALGLAGAANARMVWLDELDLSEVRQGWGTPQPCRSVSGRPMRLGGKKYERGLGSHAVGAIHIRLDGATTRFEAVVGVDDGTRERGTVIVKVYGDAELLFESGLLRGGGAPVAIDLDISGQGQLILTMGSGGDDYHHDHVDWADAKFTVEGAEPVIVARPEEERVMLTPAPPKAPRIHGPLVYGVRPGSPFLYRIPATGERPMRFAVDGLPDGLEFDEDTGIIRGAIADETPGTHPTVLRAENGAGKDERGFRIEVGETLALTPPMGWNHWYAHYDRVTGAMMREAADLMVASGMADVGYQYVNIDDCWMNAPKNKDPQRVGPLRDERGEILANTHFPDMRALTDYIHAKGLKAGLYTSPGPLTCAGFSGSHEHEAQDAQTFAEWGFDFLKYDWCSYTRVAKDQSLAAYQKPYRIMGDILKALDRDIVLNLCQYGMGDVWEWGAEVGGHCWRTAGDLGFELTQYHEVARRNARYAEWAKSGAWNDPDYLLIGYVGEAAKMGEPTPCSLTPNEQYAYMSLWCLMASPLVYSGDMSRLDDFTLNVLCNPEVIAVNQDPLGVQGGPVHEEGDMEVWTKPLEDGSLAVGIFNLGEIEQEFRVAWEDIGLEGPQRVRGLWRQQDLGVFEDGYTATVGRHGVMLLRVWPKP